MECYVATKMMAQTWRKTFPTYFPNAKGLEQMGKTIYIIIIFVKQFIYIIIYMERMAEKKRINETGKKTKC